MELKTVWMLANLDLKTILLALAAVCILSSYPLGWMTKGERGKGIRHIGALAIILYWIMKIGTWSIADAINVVGK
jgi:hypothetical protein